MSPIWPLSCSGHPRADTWALISCIFWAGSFVDYSLKMNPVMEPVIVGWQCLRHPERQPEGRTAGPTALPATSPDSHLLAGTMDPDSGALEETGSACSRHSSSRATLAWVHLPTTHTQRQQQQWYLRVEGTRHLLALVPSGSQSFSFRKEERQRVLAPAGSLWVRPGW